jgi:Family of unknown function (DUF5677)
MPSSSAARPIVGDPNLDRELRARAEALSDVVPVVLDAASRLRHQENLAQYLAIALHCTNIELFSACVLLALYGEPTPIPIILRSMYEALVDLDNLLRDATYVDRIESANLTQMLKFEDTGAMSKNEADAFKARLGEFVAKKRGPMDLRARCEKVGRGDEYKGIYALFCLDTHNNAASLTERHISERPDGSTMISVFGKYDPRTVALRLEVGVGWLFQSAHMTHGAFQIPAPQVEELADRFERERKARLIRSAG